MSKVICNNDRDSSTFSDSHLIILGTSFKLLSKMMTKLIQAGNREPKSRRDKRRDCSARGSLTTDRVESFPGALMTSIETQTVATNSP